MSVDPPVARREIEIANALGLHMRPADRFVGLAHTFQSEIKVIHQGNAFNGKSILDLTSLAAERGVRLVLEARGADAEAALEALAGLVAARFYEDDEGQPIAEPPAGPAP
jgi:phosphocarrier protein